MQHYLITNIQYATIGANRPGSTRLHASAIVLTRGQDPHKEAGVERCTMRLFGAGNALEIADRAIPSLQFGIEPVLFPEGLPPGCVSRNYTLTIGISADPHAATDVVVDLSASLHNRRPPIVDAFPDGASISDVWDLTTLRIAESWDAPFFPVVVHHPIDTVMGALRRRRR